MSQRFEVPPSLGMPDVLDVCREIYALPSGPSFEIDFAETQHFEPFGMLLLGSAIRRLRDRVDEKGAPVTVAIIGKDLAKQGHDYARHMGFWWSIGDDSDLPSMNRTATKTTIPITRLSYSELYKEAGHRDPIRAERVGAAAANLATTLSGSDPKSPLWLTLEYCFREMFRNAFEHGRVDNVWYTGATRPTKDDVQIAIVDGGRGIRSSLADNPDERHATDLAAIEAALRPGVSRNTKKVRSPEMTEKLLEQFPDQDPAIYDNTGFGLTLTSNIARDAGQFAIISGEASVAYVQDNHIVTMTMHHGTAVRLVLHPSRLDGALDRARIKANRDAGRPHSRSLISASMMTRLGLKPT